MAAGINPDMAYPNSHLVYWMRQDSNQQPLDHESSLLDRTNAQQKQKVNEFEKKK
jgi:hypothetical protein